MRRELSLQHLAVRIECLERRNRLTKRIGVSLALILGATLLTAQAGPDEKIVEAQKFVLVGPEGKPVGGLELVLGRPALVFRDGKGTRLFLTGTTGLTIWNEAGMRIVNSVATPCEKKADCGQNPIS